MTDFFSGAALNNLTQHLLPGLWPFLVALLACVVAVPAAVYLSRRFGVVAQPGGRHSHRLPTPELGGLAMWVGFALAILVFLPKDLTSLGVLLVSGLAMGLLIIDDKRGMRPVVKLAIQVGLALLAVLVFGDQIKFFSLPGGRIVQLGLLIAPVSVFWLVGMQNTVNFLDGADGLAAGVIGIVALILFMGDSGAHFLGIALGMVSILGVAKVAVAFALAAPVLALAVPIADTGWAILRRRIKGTSVAAGDRLHLHHRLQSFGLDARQTCFVFYAATALLGGLGLTLFGHGRILAVVLVATAVLTSTVVADILQHGGWRIPAPWLARLLGEPGTR